MRVLGVSHEDQVASLAAEIISQEINRFDYESENRNFVLGLPTGSTPIRTYAKLIEKFKKGTLSFKRVTTFNMDEYIGLSRDHPESYYSFMHKNFFDHIDIEKQNVNMLDGNATDPNAEAASYERRISEAGGVDLFLGGVGQDGHIAFNEPGSSLRSRTRVATLNNDTLMANARFFGNDLRKVPKTSLTIGVGTLMDSKKVLVLCTGHGKALAAKHAIEGSISHQWTITCLQMHEDATIILDSPASQELTLKTYNYFKEIEQTNIANLLAAS